MIRKEIFREYDIRGVPGKDYDTGDAFRIGRAYARLLREGGGSRVSVGRDARLTSPELTDSLIGGIRSLGVDVVDIGLCPTPVLYFSLFTLKVDGGVMVTGSHNPADQNGFKLCIGKGSIHGAEIRKLHDYVEEDGGEPLSASKTGKLETEDTVSRYIKFLADHFTPLLKKNKKIRFVVDCGNGVAGVVVRRLFEKELGLDVHFLFEEPDGRFPNHHPDPTLPESLTTLIGTLRSGKGDFGVAFDGDGDRIGVVDEKGGVLWGDQLLTIYARAILEKKPGATIIGEVKCSQHMYDDILRHGGKPIMWKTGHSLLKAKMKEEKALLAGEMSGHICFADRYYGYDDAIYAALRFAEVVVEKGKPVSSLLSDFPSTVSTPEIRLDEKSIPGLSDTNKFGIVSRVAAYFKTAYSVNTLDGVRVNFGDGWGLVRASNTQPVLVLRCEADTAERLAEIEKLLRDQVKRALAG